MTPEETALRNRFYDVARDFLDTHAPDLSTEEPPDGWANLDASGEGGSQAHRAHVALVELLVGAFTQGRTEASGALSIDDADVAEYLAREGLRCAGGEMACYAGDEDDGEVENHVGFARERAELARVTAETVASAAIPPEMMGEPGSLAEARTFDQLYCRGPFLGSPVPEPEVRLPADWRERRTANEDCDGGELYDPAEHGRETGLGWVSDPPPDEDCDGGGS